MHSGLPGSFQLCLLLFCSWVSVCGTVWLWMHYAHGEASGVCTALHPRTSALDVCVVSEVTVLDALCVLVRFQFGSTVISPLHCGAAVASGEPARGLAPPLLPTIGHSFADPSSGSVCGPSVFHGCFIVIRGVLRHPPVSLLFSSVQLCVHQSSSICRLSSSVVCAMWRQRPACICFYC